MAAVVSGREYRGEHDFTNATPIGLVTDQFYFGADVSIPNATPVTVLSGNMAALAAGNWVFVVACRARCSTLTRRIVGDLTIDGGAVQNVWSAEMKDAATSNRVPFMAYSEVFTATGTETPSFLLEMYPHLDAIVDVYYPSIHAVYLG